MFTLQSPLRYKTYGIGSGTVILTQGFGENDMDYKSLGLIGHNGIDFRTVHYQDGHALIMAAHEGTIISDGTNASQTAGIGVKILSDETEIDNKPCKIMTLYFHLLVPEYKLAGGRRRVGDVVKAGQVIALGNNSGQFTSGPHLHFGMYILWKDKNGNFTANTSNGYAGAVDPMPYLQDGNVYTLRQGMFGTNWYYMGKLVSRKEAIKHIIEV